MIAASFGAALLGAVVGGLISLVTAKSSLQETAQLNRKQKFDEEQRQAASLACVENGTFADSVANAVIELWPSRCASLS